MTHVLRPTACRGPGDAGRASRRDRRPVAAGARVRRRRALDPGDRRGAGARRPSRAGGVGGRAPGAAAAGAGRRTHRPSISAASRCSPCATCARCGRCSRANASTWCMRARALPAWIGVLGLRGLPRAQRPRLVTTVHGLNSPSRYSAVMTRGERVICVSQTVRDYVLRHYPQTDPGKLRVIPRGIDPATFPRAPHRRIATPRDLGGSAASRARRRRPAAAAAGPWHAPERPRRRAGAAGGAAQRWHSMRACGCPARARPGARPTSPNSRREAAALGIAGAVAFTAPTDAIARAYAASDLVLQLSRKPEAFGRTVVEALSVGRPVLGWAHGGVGDLLARTAAARRGRAVRRRGAARAARARCSRIRRRQPATIPAHLARDAGGHACRLRRTPR